MMYEITNMGIMCYEMVWEGLRKAAGGMDLLAR